LNLTGRKVEPAADHGERDREKRVTNLTAARRRKIAQAAAKKAL
jgi:hypothetical protein